GGTRGVGVLVRRRPPRGAEAVAGRSGPREVRPFALTLAGTKRVVELPRTAEGRAMRLIDYGHLRDGVLYHGTVSNLDGTPKSTWTYEDRGAKVTRDRPIDEDGFNF